ncbi:MAG: hypothetical protein AB7R00_30510 [Kofleriaceae bacterium]
MSSFALGALFAVVAGCMDSPPPDGGPGKMDTGPTIHETTPPPKGGGETATGCNGVTERGECKAGAAVRCDLVTGKLIRTECAALNKTCVVENERGAECQTLGGGGTDGPTSGPCGNGISEDGVCVSSMAVWCDAESMTTASFDCGAYGMTCGSGVCAEGVTCCNPQPEICAEIGYRGECVGPGTARWCGGAEDKQLITMACEPGDTCQVDVCAEGAACCAKPPGDHFDSGLDGWSSFGAPGYSLTNIGGIAQIGGDDYLAPYTKSGGMKKVLTIDPATVTLSFRWRAYSTPSMAVTTNAYLEVRDAAGMTVLFTQTLWQGYGGDTQWQMFSRNLSSVVGTRTSVSVMIYLNDAWAANLNQLIMVDDVLVTPP